MNGCVYILFDCCGRNTLLRGPSFCSKKFQGVPFRRDKKIRNSLNKFMTAVQRRRSNNPVQWNRAVQSEGV